MMKKKGFISIFVLAITLLVGCFVFTNKQSLTTYAAESVAQDCFHLLGPDGVYESNRTVGFINGTGKYVLGEENVALTATANDNFKLVGWQIIYSDQGDISEFITVDNAQNNYQEVILTTKDGESIVAIIEFSTKNNHINSSTFTLDIVFENLTIRPVFDHIYYNIQINEFVVLSKAPNQTVIDEDVLYYDSAEINGDITTYVNSYISKNTGCYYYGNLHYSDGEYYTIHKTLDDAQKEEKIDISLGAFRVEEEVKIDLPIDIQGQVKDSVNVDVLNVSISEPSNLLSKNTTDGDLANSYKIVQDEFLRTTNVFIQFNVVKSSNQINDVNINFHNLYLVDIKMVLDGNENYDELNDILGDVQAEANKILSNISFYNFYYRINPNNLQFLVKASKDNNAKSFGISCSKVVSKIINEKTYRYYEFVSLDNNTQLNSYYANIIQNIEVEIEYSSTPYSINFACVEYSSYLNDKQESVINLDLMDGNVLDSIVKTRGLEEDLQKQDSYNQLNLGYRFKGFALSLNGEVVETIKINISKEKPENQLVYMCFEKIEYTIVLANFNKVSIGGNFPINSVSFVKDSQSEKISKTLYSSDLVDGNVSKQQIVIETIKINDLFEISEVLNPGFRVLGYSLVDPSNVTGKDYLTVNAEGKISFAFNKEFIEANNIVNDVITIYVYEDIMKYSITYYIEETQDNKLNKDVIMASISAQQQVEQGQILNAIITKYKIASYDESGNAVYEEILENDTTSIVAKIVISNLIRNDKVNLISTGFVVTGNENYEYLFNRFTEENKPTSLSYNQTGKTYTHSEIVTNNRIIKVVYSMPSTKVIITIDEEFASNSNFSYNYAVEGDSVERDETDEDTFILTYGDDIHIAINNIAFGYVLNECVVVELGNEEISNISFNNGVYSFSWTPEAGVNTIKLIFSRIEYHFIFNQYGAGLNGESATIDGKNYAMLDVDNCEVSIQKPLGYYVSSVAFGNNNDYSVKLSEDNDYRANSDILNYVFKMDREDFKNVVTNYGVINGFGISEVLVDLNYLIFEYTITVAYGITNPKGNVNDSFVVYPGIGISYEFENTTTTQQGISSNGLVIFNNIPYGVNPTLSLYDEVTRGFSLAGWTYANGNNISQQEYPHSFEYLSITSIDDDKEFKYLISYNAYQINVVFASGEGNPNIFVRGVISKDKKITLYDSMLIEPNAYRNKGYGFEKITYKAPVYTEYVYSEETWSLNYSKLYLKGTNGYKLNQIDTYNSEEKYYIYSEKEIECFENLDVNSFSLSDFALDEDGKTITINVIYKLLELYIENEIKEKVGIGEAAKWTLLGRGSNDSRIEFNIDDLAIIQIIATNQQGEERIIEEGVHVTFYDTIKLNISINKSARNIDGKVYDLSLGLTLNGLKVGTQNIAFSSNGSGEYDAIFFVGQYFPEVGDEIKLTYTLAVQSERVYVTTIVENSDTFYNNVQLHINAEKYDFASEYKFSDYNSMASFVEQDLQFLATTDVSANLVSNTYKQNFDVAGVKIYANNTFIKAEDYVKYGIVLNEDGSVTARIICDLEARFIIQPKITYNGGPTYTKVFTCNNAGVGTPQSLSIGNSSNYDIQIDSTLVGSISITYQLADANLVPTDTVTNVGRYNVSMKFSNTENFDWLSQISVAEDIVLIIQPKDVYLTYDVNNITKVEKPYDGTSNFDVTKIKNNLLITDNSSLNVKYSDVINNGNNNFALSSISAYISSAGKDFAVKVANENLYYNLYVYDFALKDTSFNKNFNLKNTELIIYEFIKIKKREIQLGGVAVLSKVYDGTDKAQLYTPENITVSKIISGDDVSINIDRLNPRFEDSSVGTNKKVIMDTTSSLVGADAGNYYISIINVAGLKIYPYSLSFEINGVGTVEVINKRGLTEQNMIDLIPINANLIVNPIYHGSNSYASIYSKISNRLKGNNEFAIGYEISFLINGERRVVPNSLYLSIPTQKNLTGTYFLNSERNGTISFVYENGNMLIDLSQINEEIDCVFLTKSKIYLKAWQIVLIVIGSLLLVAIAVIVFIILRKTKIDRDSVHEKI